MRIDSIPVGQINPAQYNPRKELQPGDTEYEKLKRSISEFGYVEPLVWNRRTGNLVGGHQRFKVLMESDLTALDVSVVDLDETQEKLLNLALNKVSGEWDEERLVALLDDLQADGADLNLSGFDEAEIEDLLSQFREDADLDGTFENNEINLGSFDDDNFECKCPRCGFVFNPKEKVGTDA